LKRIVGYMFLNVKLPGRVAWVQATQYGAPRASCRDREQFLLQLSVLANVAPYFYFHELANCPLLA
jgi:hypothetical protein